MSSRTLSAVAFAALLAALPLFAQDRHPLDIPDTTQREVPQQRQRLILKDGTYQIVLSYKVVGNVVRYQSAERNGETEDIPLSMVDLPATERWKREHEAGAADRPAVLSPELAKEEAARAARTPEIAPDLRLPEEDSVLALDTFQSTPELVPMPQQNSDLNRETAHSVQKIAINPSSAPHRLGDIRTDKADVQLHVADPVFYVRIGTDDAPDPRGGGFVVDTHGASSRATPGGGAVSSDYIIEHVDVRYDSRQIDSFRISALGTGKKQPDIIELKSDYLPGGQWLKLTPVQPLEFGEYALIEILNDHEVNLNVWDFGVHPTAPENVEAQRPEKHRPITLEHRKPQ